MLPHPIFPPNVTSLSRGKMLTAALNADPVKSGQAYDVPAISQGGQMMTTINATAKRSKTKNDRMTTTKQ